MTPDAADPPGVDAGRAGFPAAVGGRRGVLGRFLPPELCLVAAILLVLACVSISGQAGDEAARGTLGRHASPVEGLAFAPDGRTAASASRDGTVRVWDLGTPDSGRVVATAHAGFSSLAFSPDGRRLVAGQFDGGVTLHDPDTGAVAASFPAHGSAVRAVGFAPDGSAVAAAGDDRSIRVGDAATGRERLALRGHGGFIQGLAFAPDGLSLASVSIDGEAIVWDLASGRILERFRPGPGPLSAVAFSPDGRRLALGGTGRVVLRDVATGRSLAWPGARGRITAVRFLGGGTALATSGMDGSVAIWDLSPAGPRPRASFRGHEGGVKALAVSPDGATLLSGGNDDAVRSWDVAGLTSE